MLLRDLTQFIIFILALVAITPWLGYYLSSVFTGQRTWMHSIFGWLEAATYKVTGVDPSREMSWIEYSWTVIWFNVLGFVVIVSILLFQGFLPLNPQQFPGMSWSLAFNTAVSFVTNTNWQAYAGETTLSYLSQSVGLTVQNFLSAATGLSVAIALIRGITRHSSSSIGNFWSDLVRSLVYLFVPLSIILAVVLVSEGSIQNFDAYVEVETLEGLKQIIPGGPVASQVAIKQLGTNGGGFFNTNSAHPFENPSAFSNWLQMLALAAIPAATIYAYGIMVGSNKHGCILLSALLFLWLGGVAVSFYSQNLLNPSLSISQPMEGIETRLGTVNSLIWASMTTATSNGSVNAMISSLAPLAGGISMFNIMLGEIIFGGIGVGLCSLIMFIFLTVFLSGLMVGRTPEYMGKKIEKHEMKWVMVSVLLPGILILIGAGVSSVHPTALAGLGNHGPHGLSEILYAFSSAAGNNGSAFAGLNADTPYYNINLGLIMLSARLAILIPSLGIAGLLASKKTVSQSIGSFSTNSLLFMVLLISVIIIVGALAFFPALSLGPIAEHFLMLEGQTF